ncbi:Hypothetical protein FKW44_006188, partial [Caligus rogercresseyi]
VLRAVRSQDDKTNMGIRTGRPITATTFSAVKKVKGMAKKKPIRNTADIMEVCTSWPRPALNPRPSVTQSSRSKYR